MTFSFREDALLGNVLPAENGWTVEKKSSNPYNDHLQYCVSGHPFLCPVTHLRNIEVTYISSISTGTIGTLECGPLKFDGQWWYIVLEIGVITSLWEPQKRYVWNIHSNKHYQGDWLSDVFWECASDHKLENKGFSWANIHCSFWNWLSLVAYVFYGISCGTGL